MILIVYEIIVKVYSSMMYCFELIYIDYVNKYIIVLYFNFCKK